VDASNKVVDYNPATEPSLFETDGLVPPLPDQAHQS
jgi:hypothetical protein